MALKTPNLKIERYTSAVKVGVFSVGHIVHLPSGTYGGWTQRQGEYREQSEDWIAFGHIGSVHSLEMISWFETSTMEEHRTLADAPLMWKVGANIPVHLEKGI